METIHGGYYVNCGQLEFKKVELGEDTSEFEEIRVGKKRVSIETRSKRPQTEKKPHYGIFISEWRLEKRRFRQ